MTDENSDKDAVVFAAEEDLLPLGKKGCKQCKGQGCTDCGGTGHAILENAAANDTYKKTLTLLRERMGGRLRG